MRLNDIITEKIKKDFNEQTGLSGKAARKILRGIAKDALSPIGNNKGDTYNKVKRSRKDRKKLAKLLKVPFEPRYNGPVYRLVRKLDDDGKQVIEYQEVQ